MLSLRKRTGSFNTPKSCGLSYHTRPVNREALCLPRPSTTSSDTILNRPVNMILSTAVREHLLIGLGQVVRGVLVVGNPANSSEDASPGLLGCGGVVEALRVHHSHHHGVCVALVLSQDDDSFAAKSSLFVFVLGHLMRVEMRQCD